VVGGRRYKKRGEFAYFFLLFDAVLLANKLLNIVLIAGKSIIQMVLQRHQVTAGGLQLSCFMLQTFHNIPF